MKIVICGGGGFIGQSLARLLLVKGYEVIILDRNQSRVSSPKLQSFIVDLLNPKLFEKRWFLGVDTVINLSGKDILTLWTEDYKKAIWDSRVTVNKHLVDFISSLDQKPKTFISASATGYYEGKGKRKLTRPEHTVRVPRRCLCRLGERSTPRRDIGYAFRSGENSACS